MVNKKISVLMPAFNSENFIAKTIDSVLSQSYSNFELLIIDDCSTDSTAEIIQYYSKLDSRICFFLNDVNKGISFCRNFLLNKSNCDFFAIIDSDDICEIDRLEIQINYLHNNPDVFGVGSNISLIDGNSNHINSKLTSLINYNRINFRILFKNCFNQSTMMLRSSSLRYDEKFPPAEDFEFWSRIILEHNLKLVNLPNLLIKYRIHSNNNGNLNQVKQLHLNDIIIRKNFKNYLEWELNDEYLYICHHHYNPNFNLKFSILNYLKLTFSYYYILFRRLNKVNPRIFRYFIIEISYDFLVRTYAIKNCYFARKK